MADNEKETPLAASTSNTTISFNSIMASSNLIKNPDENEQLPPTSLTATSRGIDSIASAPKTNSDEAMAFIDLRGTSDFDENESIFSNTPSEFEIEPHDYLAQADDKTNFDPRSPSVPPIWRPITPLSYPSFNPYTLEDFNPDQIHPQDVIPTDLTPAPTFHDFRKLPPELRSMITGLAASDTSQIVHCDMNWLNLDDENDYIVLTTFDPYHGNHEFPGIYRASNETRSEARRLFTRTHTRIPYSFELIPNNLNPEVNYLPYLHENNELCFYAEIQAQKRRCGNLRQKYDCDLWGRFFGSFYEGEPLTRNLEFRGMVKYYVGADKLVLDPCYLPLENYWYFPDVQGRRLDRLLHRFKHLAINLSLRPYGFDVYAWNERALHQKYEDWAARIVEPFMEGFVRQVILEYHKLHPRTLDIVIPEKIGQGPDWEALYVVESGVPYRRKGEKRFVDWKTKVGETPGAPMWKWIHTPKVLRIIEHEMRVWIAKTNSKKKKVKSICQKCSWWLQSIRIVIARFWT
ncbi:hypothetical protein G7Y89_g10429 [Cudoniella acicularis]|uniref:2EXR domain-containing protein n=1 Tax=Cudoniella acicularis TaxID=354080 RepID=A0A8H4W1M2_9HELO|nr:hypothetical protein G7Y89_g10429 [Cudoniella acicularis]